MVVNEQGEIELTDADIAACNAEADAIFDELMEALNEGPNDALGVAYAL